MDEQALNISVRKFLKHFGVTSQREIEKAIGAAREGGKLKGDETLPVSATLSIPGLLEGVKIEGKLTLRDEPDTDAGADAPNPGR